MRKVLPIIVIIIISAFSAGGILSYTSSKSSNTRVSARVEGFNLDVSGWISPFASVVMTGTTGREFIRSAVADREGNFYMTGIPVKKGFSGFCLISIDFQRLGESEVCFSFPPAEKNIEMKNLFLPPTVGLQRTEMVEGSTVYVFGYTMPLAVVTLNLNESTSITGIKSTTGTTWERDEDAVVATSSQTQNQSHVLGASYVKGKFDINRENSAKVRVVANAKGLYEFPISNLKRGSYQLYSTSFYKNSESLKPSSYKELKVLSWWENFIAFFRDLWKSIINLLTSIALGPLWLAIPILILIIILVYKLNRDKILRLLERIPAFEKFIIWFRKRFRKRKLHHYWFIGY